MNTKNYFLLTQLTPREIEVLKCIAIGLINKDIGKRLGVRKRTIDTHVSNMLSKTHCKNRVSLVQWGFYFDYLSLSELNYQ